MPKIVIPAKYKNVSDGVYVGNETSMYEHLFMVAADIGAVINLTGKPIINHDTDFYEFSLPSQELMNTEVNKTVSKLESICQTITNLRSANKKVLICCTDGKNKCMLAAGFYMISIGQKCENVIESLEVAYFSPEQILEDRADQLFLQQQTEQIQRDEDERQTRLRNDELNDIEIETDINDPPKKVLYDEEQKRVDSEFKQREEKRADRREIRCLTLASFRKILRVKSGLKN